MIMETQRQHQGLLIKDAVILTANREARIIERGDICVSGDRIFHIGPSVSTPPGFVPTAIVQAKGKVAMPGLVNAHCHAAMTLFRGYADDLPIKEWLEDKIWPVEAKLTAKVVYWGTMLSCAEMVKSGTTAFADMYFFMDEAARAVEKTGMRACLSTGLIGVLPGTRYGLDEGRDFCKKWNGGAGGRITTMLGPHAPYTCPPKFLDKVMDAAHELGTPLHIHLSETEFEVKKSIEDYGASPVKFVSGLGLFDLPTLAAHCVHLCDGDIEILAEKTVCVAHNPGSNMKLGSGIAPVPKMLRAGVNVGIGTDGAASNNNLDMFEEMRLTALLHKAGLQDPTVCPAGEALAMATRKGAAALRLGHETGALEVGKKADIILVDFNALHLSPVYDYVSHIVYAARACDVTHTIVDGKLVMEDRKILTVDEEEIIAEVDRCVRNVLKIRK